MDTAATIHYNRVQGCIGRTLSLMVVGKDQLQIVRGHSICVSPMQIARDVLLPDVHPGHSLTYIHFSSGPLIQHSPEAGSPEERLL